MKRIDLFLNEREVEKVCKAMLKAGAPGYSVMRHVTGMGVGGEISEAMDFSSFGANAHVIVVCEASLLQALREAVKPVLRRYGGGGLCLRRRDLLSWSLLSWILLSRSLLSRRLILAGGDGAPMARQGSRPPALLTFCKPLIRSAYLVAR